ARTVPSSQTLAATQFRYTLDDCLESLYQLALRVEPVICRGSPNGGSLHQSFHGAVDGSVAELHASSESLVLVVFPDVQPGKFLAAKLIFHCETAPGMRCGESPKLLRRVHQKRVDQLAVLDSTAHRQITRNRASAFRPEKGSLGIFAGAEAARDRRFEPSDARLQKWRAKGYVLAPCNRAVPCAEVFGNGFAQHGLAAAFKSSGKAQ